MSATDFHYNMPSHFCGFQQRNIRRQSSSWRHEVRSPNQYAIGALINAHNQSDDPTEFLRLVLIAFDTKITELQKTRTTGGDDRAKAKAKAQNPKLIAKNAQPKFKSARRKKSPAKKAVAKTLVITVEAKVGQASCNSSRIRERDSCGTDSAIFY